MLALNYILILLSALGFVVPYFICRTKQKKYPFFKIIKILAIATLSIFIVRYMSGYDCIQEALGLECDIFASKGSTFVALLLNWWLTAIIIYLAIAPFFDIKNKHLFVCLFCFPVVVACIIAYPILAKGIVGADAFAAFNFRVTLMALELGFVFAYCLMFTVEKLWFDGLRVEGEKAKGFGNKKDYLSLLFLIPMLIAAMPSFTLKGLFGYYGSSIEIKNLSQLHRLVLYASLLIPLLIWYVLHKKDKQTIKFCLLYISIGTLISFSIAHKFETFLDITAWPFHLCNTAMYIIPLCIIFKWDKLFYFTYFINIFGAFAAMAMPNYDAELNLFSIRVVNFYINHFSAFFMPILLVALRLYDRPKIKQFWYSMCGFAFYFLLVLILNAWFSNFAKVDYFFINSDFIASKLGTWAENLRLVVAQFSIGELKFVFYPLYQALYFIVYVAIGFCMWFLYEQCYAFADTLTDMSQRRKKIKADQIALEYSIANKEIQMDNNQPIKLELINFTKRYGSSNVYAVKDANLKIEGGEIFGFLGHNGAGKSTIIKSIVGIQPITSGKIKVCGYDVDLQSVQAKRMIGFVPDHYALYEKLTGREYINYVADLWGVSQEDRNKQIEKYVKLFELTGSFDNQIKTYSHGMKQKITIISALVHNPRVWILDEPLTGLDPASIFQVKECMKEHARQGNIVFFSSHIIDVVETICTRIAIIKKGHILTTKTLKEIQQTSTLEKFYLDITNTDVQATAVEPKTAAKNTNTKNLNNLDKDKKDTSNTLGNSTDTKDSKRNATDDFQNNPNNLNVAASDKISNTLDNNSALSDNEFQSSLNNSNTKSNVHKAKHPKHINDKKLVKEIEAQLNGTKSSKKARAKK